MYEHEERRLMDMKQSMEQVDVPDEIDLHIQLGMRRAKQARRRRAITAISGAAAALLFVVLVATVRVSPVMAAYIAQVPGMQAVVELIRSDLGVKKAIEHEMMQPIGIADTHAGITFEVHHILADASRLLVFYEITGPGDLDLRRLEMDKLKLTRPDGSTIDGYSVGLMGNVDDPGAYSSYLDFTFSDPVDYPEYLTLTTAFRLSDTPASGTHPSHSSAPPAYETEWSVKHSSTPPAYEALEHEWSVKLPIDESKFANLEKTIPIGETVEIEGQRVTFERLIVRPTRMELYIAYDPANTKRIFSFDDLQFVDERGTAYRPIANGVTGQPFDEDHVALYFQSSFFSEADTLHLAGSSAKALDKSRLQVQIDLEREQLLSRPDDRLRLSGVNKSDAGLELRFKLRNDHPSDTSFIYNVFSHLMVDAEGRTFERTSAGSSSRMDGENEIFLWFPMQEPIASPVTLTVDQYPTRIEKPFRIRVE